MPVVALPFLTEWICLMGGIVSDGALTLTSINQIPLLRPIFIEPSKEGLGAKGPIQYEHCGALLYKETLLLSMH